VIFYGNLYFNVKNSEFELKKETYFFEYCFIDEKLIGSRKNHKLPCSRSWKQLQVTMDGTTYKMEATFIVYWPHKNSIGARKGPYALPEAQLDRFLFK